MARIESSSGPVTVGPARRAELGAVDAEFDSPQPPLAGAVCLSLAAPAYNEAEGIEAVVRQWSATLAGSHRSFEIVICNDGSRDATGAILASLSREVPQLRVDNQPKNRGYGSALNSAIALCRGDFVATIDSDGQFSVADAPAMLGPLLQGDCDAVLGYRVAKSDSWLRRRADRLLNRLVRFLFGVRQRDTNCALKVVRRELLQELLIESTGFAFPTEVSIKLHEHGARVVESPVQHSDRAAGASKLHVWRTGWQVLRFLIYLRLRLSLYRARIIQRF
ncbi:MAG: glycosyltransferase family 2 protein [Pirellulales bacterium]|nr:glycosyltransferase family 2 protein [Pirellulales bacterium]